MIIHIYAKVSNKWRVSNFGVTLIDNAIDLSIKNNLDFEDILQCLCAKKNNCNYLVTGDSKFYDCGVNIYTATDFLKRKE
ncbi:MAG: hypothetical protein Ctma_0633 [Catillopecten margaritatus gill symbiont]|uniref:PIN domain-containing protein n=1 Tax=Catillopecten margaritatus gill symbiont TaxID=3083288 RepID=A0AAU6PFY8_9GAMM